jgi:hypothetical protein
MSDLNEQAEAFRKLNDEQLGDLFELCHWIIDQSTQPDNEIPWHIYRVAVNFVTDKQKEIESGAKAKD